MKTSKTIAQHVYTLTAPGAVSVTAEENGKTYPLASLGPKGGQTTFRAINSMVYIQGECDESAIIHPFSSRAVALGRTNVTLNDLVQESLANSASGHAVGAYTFAGVTDFEWRAALTSLSYGYKTFYESAIIRFYPEGGLPNLARAPYMFLGARALSHFKAEMPNISNMDYMFAGTSLKIFECSALPILNSAVGAFNDTNLPADEIVRILDMLPNHLSQEMWPRRVVNGIPEDWSTNSRHYQAMREAASVVKHPIDFENCLGVPDVPAEAWAAAEAKGWTIRRSGKVYYSTADEVVRKLSAPYVDLFG